MYLIYFLIGIIVSIFVVWKMYIKNIIFNIYQKDYNKQKFQHELIDAITSNSEIYISFFLCVIFWLPILFIICCCYLISFIYLVIRFIFIKMPAIIVAKLFSIKFYKK